MKIPKHLAPLCTIFLLITSILLTGCQRETASNKPTKKDYIESTTFALDTVITIRLYGTEDVEILRKCVSICQEYEKKMSRTIPDSEVSQLNKYGTYEMSPDIAELIRTSKEYAQITNGAFDITVGAITPLWDFKAESPTLPNANTIQEKLKTVSYENIVLDGNKVTLTSGAQIDLGGIAKGYIGDQIAKYVSEQNIDGALINLGGDVRAVGHKPNQQPFIVGIQTPFSAAKQTLGSVSLSGDGCVISSGIYERFFQYEDHLYHHILDPKTGYPTDNELSSVSIIGTNGTQAEALSTACFVMGIDAALNFIENIDNIECIFVLKNGDIITSSKAKEKYNFIEDANKKQNP